MEVVVEEIGVLEPFCATDHVPKEKSNCTIFMETIDSLLALGYKMPYSLM